MKILVFALIALPVIALPAAQEATITIPRAAHTHKRILTQHARGAWGINAPVATFAAQIHQESLWRADVVSRAGASGIAQFMPATGEWLANKYKLGDYDPLNPAWSIRAMVVYDLHLYQLIDGADGCQRFAKTLSAYNGGLTWLRRDEQLATTNGINISYWFDGVETVNAGRAAWAIHENRAYPRRILLELEPLYIDAGFGRGVCQ
jgi:soluble lytic murein transglycosylase-like protein